MSRTRLVLAVLAVWATVAVAGAAREPASNQAMPVDVPYAIGPWRGADADDIDAETRRAVAADLVLNRTYAGLDGAAVGLYFAYYARQRPGVSIHSPLHCLPGTGWDILSDETLSTDLLDGTRGPVRRLVAQKASSRVLILYWYSIDGRMIANDTVSRLVLLYDRVRRGRNDGALVRLVVPIADSEADAERRGVSFVRALVPYL